MARTAKEIEEQIEFLTLRRNRTRSTDGWMSLNERISYLKGELMLQREKEAGTHKPSPKVCHRCGQRYYPHWAHSQPDTCTGCHTQPYRKRFMAFD